MSKIEFDALGNTTLPAIFDGNASVTLIEPAGSPLPGNRQVDSKKDFEIKVDWEQRGIIASVMGTLGGTWTVEVYYDRIGGQWFEEGPLSPLAPVSFPAVNADPQPYTTKFTVPANSIDPGVYTLAVLITGEASGLRFSGYEEIRPFRVY